MSFSKKLTVRVLAKGGILTPSHLLKILDVVKKTGNKHVHLGSRQDILFHIPAINLPLLEEAFRNIQTEYIIHGQTGSNFQNIVSSYVSCDLIAGTNWVKAGNYLNILENISYKHKLRINITDPQQSLIPVFYGNINFVASTVTDYWFVFIRKDHNSVPECWPVLVYNNDIAALAEAIEINWEIALANNLPDLFEYLQTKCEFKWKNIEQPFRLTPSSHQDYEGFGRMYNTSNLWAGFYWRNNSYDISFFEEVCQLCLRTGISKICVTTWKSFLIKEIKDKDMYLWYRLLGRFGINMRHSSFELNWHLPLEDKHALCLKKFLVKKFDKVDISVSGLTFGIKTKPEPSFCVIQIEKSQGIPFLKSWDPFYSYKVYYAKNFDANTCEYEEYATQVPRYRLPEVLHLLTRKYYAQLSLVQDKIEKSSKPAKTENITVYQCIHCQTIYNEKTSGKSFAELPESFICPLCDAPKTDFKPVLLNHLVKSH